MIRSSVASNPAILEQFEQLLFPVFTPIFTNDVAGTVDLLLGNIFEICPLEFVPYVLQIIGFLLESRPSGSSSIPDAYRALFNSIISPTFWDRTGNIPALSRLLQAYIEKAGQSIVMEKLVNELCFSFDSRDVQGFVDDGLGHFSTSRISIESS